MTELTCSVTPKTHPTESDCQSSNVFVGTAFGGAGFGLTSTFGGGVAVAEDGFLNGTGAGVDDDDDATGVFAGSGRVTGGVAGAAGRGDGTAAAGREVEAAEGVDGPAAVIPGVDEPEPEPDGDGELGAAPPPPSRSSRFIRIWRNRSGRTA